MGGARNSGVCGAVRKLLTRAFHFCAFCGGCVKNINPNFEWIQTLFSFQREKIIRVFCIMHRIIDNLLYIHLQGIHKTNSMLFQRHITGYEMQIWLHQPGLLTILYIMTTSHHAIYAALLSLYDTVTHL